MVFWINFVLNSNTQANRLTFSTSGGRGDSLEQSESERISIQFKHITVINVVFHFSLLNKLISTNIYIYTREIAKKKIKDTKISDMKIHETARTSSSSEKCPN